MKTILVTEYGTEEIQYTRQYTVAVPDDFEKHWTGPELETALSDLADEQEIPWGDGDSTGIQTTFQPIDVDGEPVISVMSSGVAFIGQMFLPDDEEEQQ